MPQIPERLTNFRCYRAGVEELLGLTDIELPSFEAMTETISGAGIAGEYASPVTGHFGSQMLKVKYRTVTDVGLALLAPVRQMLDCRGSIQVQDPTNSVIISKALRVECTGQVKHFNPGKLEAGKVMGAEMDVEIAVIRISLDDVEIIELDKFNMIFRVNGVDYLQKTRTDLGGV